MKSTDRFNCKSDIVLREESDDWALLFDSSTGEVFGVNPVGASIWRLLINSKSIDEIKNSILIEFDECPDSISQEINQFITTLIEKKFIENSHD